MRLSFNTGTLIWLGLAHFLNDAASGWLLFGQTDLQTGLLNFVIYNLLAFASQPLRGYLTDL